MCFYITFLIFAVIILCKLLIFFQNKHLGVIPHRCLLFFLFWEFAELLESFRSDRHSSSAKKKKSVTIIDQ